MNRNLSSTHEEDCNESIIEEKSEFFEPNIYIRQNEQGENYRKSTGTSYYRPKTMMCDENPKSPKPNLIKFPESYLAKVNEYLEGVEKRKKAWETITQRASDHATSSLEIDNLTTRLETPDGVEQGGNTNLERDIPIIQERDPEYAYLMMKEQRKRLLIHNKIRDNSCLGISMNKGKLEGIGQEERVPVNFDHNKDNKESTEEMGEIKITQVQHCNCGEHFKTAQEKTIT